MAYENIVIDTTDRIALVTINRPKALNALNSSVIEELKSVFNELEKNQDVGGIILTGAGEKAFVAGADIKEMQPLDESGAKEFAKNGQHLFSTIEKFPKPVIGAINGFALGGGCELAMACHFRIASSNAKFGQPEVNLGLIPGFGGTQRLARLVGKGAALRLLMTAELIKADVAEQIGLVQKVVEQGKLIDTCKEMMTGMLTKGPVALSYCIEAVNRGLDLPLEEAMDLEAELFGKIFNTQDKTEGLTAFIEKRDPSFSGK